MRLRAKGGDAPVKPTQFEAWGGDGRKVVLRVTQADPGVDGPASWFSKALPEHLAIGGEPI